MIENANTNKQTGWKINVRSRNVTLFTELVLFVESVLDSFKFKKHHIYIYRFQDMFSMRKNMFYFFEKSQSWKRLLFCYGFHKYDYLFCSHTFRNPFDPLQICLLMTSNSPQNLHTAKGWKRIARDGQKEEFVPDKPPLFCEEGTGAVCHLNLIQKLQNCKTVSDQLKTFSSVMSLTTEDIKNRKEFCESLAEIFCPYFSEFKINLFGSSINGLGFKGCDADVSIQTIFSEDKEYLTDIKQVPTLDSVLQGETSKHTIAHLPPRFLLRFVRRILRQHCPDVKEPILLIKAKCPLLRFYNSKYDLFCDFSCESFTSLRNTKLIRLLCHLDERFIHLAKFLRYWGKYGGFVGDIDLFNSYAFSLLVVNFLQQRNPPILPPIGDLYEKSEYLKHGNISDDELLLNDVKKFPKSKNTQTLEQLLREFFFYYLNFDYSDVIVPASGTVVPKADFVAGRDSSSDYFEFSSVSTQDPFQPNFNTTMAATFRSCKRFLNGLVISCFMYQDGNVWNPGLEMWGICSLFHRIIYDNEIIKKWQENTMHTIKLSAETDVSLVKKILQQCLLFDCSELIIPKNKKSYLMRLSCKAYNNTWQGRHSIKKNCNQSFTNCLEKEAWVSKEVLKKKEENRKVLFTFLCECIKHEQDEELSVVFTFTESKYPPMVAIFLKEFIPSLCEQIKK